MDESRLRAVGFGFRKPIADNTTEAGMAQNRRVLFTIEKKGPTNSHAILGGSGPASVLPAHGNILPDKGELPDKGVLPAGKDRPTVLPAKPSVLPGAVLPQQPGLPQKSTLPSRRGVLPWANELNTGPAPKP